MGINARLPCDDTMMARMEVPPESDVTKSLSYVKYQVNKFGRSEMKGSQSSNHWRPIRFGLPWYDNECSVFADRFVLSILLTFLPRLVSAKRVVTNGLRRQWRLGLLYWAAFVVAGASRTKPYRLSDHER